MAEQDGTMESMNEDKKKYTLASLDENIEKEPVFYYSREHRLERASPRVRELNSSEFGKMTVTKRLFGSRGNVTTFIMIIIACLMISFFSKYSQAITNVKLGGNTVTIAIIKEEEALILDITKQGPKTGAAYAGEVDIAVSPIKVKTKVKSESKLNEGETPPVFYHRVYFAQAGYESFQISLPFDSNENEFLLLLGTADEQKSVKLRAKY
jgi:hypothetical protein